MGCAYFLMAKFVMIYIFLFFISQAGRTVPAIYSPVLPMSSINKGRKACFFTPNAKAIPAVVIPASIFQHSHILSKPPTQSITILAAHVSKRL